MLMYLALFVSSFLAATILPFYSEILLYSLLQQNYSAFGLWAVAATGNTLGAVVNWWLGHFLLRFQHKKWFYFKPEQIAQAQRWFQKYGVWTLLMAWAPVVGDTLTLVAGIMRVRLPLFLLLVGIGKGLRYLFVLWVALNW